MSSNINKDIDFIKNQSMRLQEQICHRHTNQIFNWVDSSTHPPTINGNQSVFVLLRLTNRTIITGYYDYSIGSYVMVHLHTQRIGNDYVREWCTLPNDDPVHGN